MNIDVNKLNNVEALTKSLAELEEYEHSLNSVSMAFCERQSEYNDRISYLQKSLSELNSLQSDGKTLQNITRVAADIGMQLSGKVRQLDLAKNRVKRVEDIIENIIGLKSCSVVATKAVEAGEIIEAVSAISEYIQMDQETLKIVALIEKENVGLNILSTLSALQKSICELLVSSFKSASGGECENDENVYKFFRLFPALGESEMGLSMYGDFVVSKVAQMAEEIRKNNLAAVNTTSRPTAYVDTMTNILECVAKSIKSSESVLEECYGPGYTFKLIRIVQRECDRQTGQIFMEYKEKRSLSIALQRARQELLINGKSTISTTTGSSLPIHSSIFDQCLSSEALISELVILNARIELYLNFLRRRLQIDFIEKEKCNREKEIRQFFDSCSLLNMSQEIIAAYLPQEQLFLRELVNKAVLMDEVEETSKTFRMIDDVFFVVKKCLSRAISSGSIDAVCAMFNHSNAVLTDQLIKGVLSVRSQQYISSGWIQQAYNLVHKRAGSGTIKTSILGAGSASSTDTSSFGSSNTSTTIDPQVQYLCTLNSLEACLHCLEILKNTLEQFMKDVFGLHCQSDLVKLQTCLADLDRSLSIAFRELLNNGFEQLRGVIRPQINTLTQTFNSLKGEPSEEEFDQCSVNEPMIEALINGLQNLLKPFKAIMSQGNYEQMISLLADELLLRLERLIQQKTFNRYGALHLDKELRYLLTFFTSLSNSSCREKFARILQISKLLNLEKIDEVNYYGNTSNWRLSVSEIRRFLTLRVDFPANEIRRLHF